MCTMTKGDCVAGWNLTGNAVSAEFDGSDEQERKELSVSQAVEIAAGALDAVGADTATHGRTGIPDIAGQDFLAV